MSRTHLPASFQAHKSQFKFNTRPEEGIVSVFLQHVFSFTNWNHSVNEIAFAECFYCFETLLPSDSLYWSSLSDISRMAIISKPLVSWHMKYIHRYIHTLICLSHSPTSFCSSKNSIHFHCPSACQHAATGTLLLHSSLTWFFSLLMQEVIILTNKLTALNALCKCNNLK